MGVLQVRGHLGLVKARPIGCRQSANSKGAVTMLFSSSVALVGSVVVWRMGPAPEGPACGRSSLARGSPLYLLLLCKCAHELGRRALSRIDRIASPVRALEAQ